MKLVALCVARNESWVVGLSLRAAMMYCDAAVVLVHASTDATLDIVREIESENPGRVHILIENDPVWREMQQRQRTLDEARRIGGTHMVIADCDEVLVGTALPGIRGAIERLSPGRYLSTQMYAMWRGIDKYRHDASIWSDTRQRGLVLAFRDRPDLNWRALNGYDHHNRPPCGSAHGYFFDAGIMHLQFASWRRLVAKHRLYKMIERVRWPHKRVAEIDRMYSMALNEDGIHLADAPPSWWEPYADLMKHLQLDAIPWQEAESERLMALHGAETFAGLNLYWPQECVA